MKIFINDCVFVQKGDVAYLNSYCFPIPISIYEKVFDKGIIIINDNNRFDFIKFDEKREIEFFKCIDWIADFDELKNLSCDRINELCEKVSNERQKIILTYNSLPISEKKEYIDMFNKIELLECKLNSLRNFLLFKLGDISMRLPDGVFYPIECNRENHASKVKKYK